MMAAVHRHGLRCGGRAAGLAATKLRTISVYTRTGDGGQSSLFSGERRHKDDPVFEALGAVDELNAAVGMAYTHCEAFASGAHVTGAAAPPPGPESLGWLLPQLKEVQYRLLDVGSAVATPQSTSTSERLAYVRFDGADEARALESHIDAMEAHLSPLTVFILPGGGAPSASLHVARAICRRAERSVFTLVRRGECDAGVAVYLNRLSDYFFVAARFAAASVDYPEARREQRKG